MRWAARHVSGGGRRLVKSAGPDEEGGLALAMETLKDMEVTRLQARDGRDAQDRPCRAG